MFSDRIKMEEKLENIDGIDLNEGISITSRDVGRPTEFSDVERLDGKLVIVKSRKEEVRLIGRLYSRKISGATFKEMPGSENSPRGKHLIVDKYYRRDSTACYEIESLEEFEKRDMHYVLDEEKVSEIERYLAELSKFPFNISLNRDDSI